MNSSPRIVEGFFSRKEGGLYFIVHPQRPLWLFVNEQGWNIINLLNGANSLSKIIGMVGTDVVDRSNVSSFISSLSSAGLLETSENMCGLQETGFLNTFLHITRKCNLSCRHCYYPSENSDLNNELSIREIMDYLDKFYSQGGRSVTISGGEPFIRGELVKQIVAMKDWDSVNILTNGTMINEEVIGLLENYPKVSLQVSLDGGTSEVHDSVRGKGSFSAVSSGLKKVALNGLSCRITVCTTVINQCLDDLEAVTDMCASLGIATARYIPLRNKGRAAGNCNLTDCGDSRGLCEDFFSGSYINSHGVKIVRGVGGFAMVKKDFSNNMHWCPAGRNLVVDSIGNVYPCVLLMCSQYRIGNIRDNCFFDLSSSPVLKVISEALEQRTSMLAECRQCLWKNFCQAGCMGMALERFGSIWREDEFCACRKELYETALKKLSLKLAGV